MNFKNKFVILLSLIFILTLMLIKGNFVYADWWERPTAHPTQPSFGRDLPPTSPPSEPTTPPGQPTSAPTTPPSQPTVTPPRTGGPTVEPTTAPSSSTSDGDNACDPGDPFSGPYCGWSPEVGGGGVGGPESVYGPQVMGLSYTSGGELEPSDIILLTGVLCLLLYARSKLNVADRKHLR